MTYWKGLRAIGPNWHAGPMQFRQTNSVELCAKQCVEYGEDCAVFSWNEVVKTCILMADWLMTETAGEERTWSGHRCNLLGGDELPQNPQQGSK